MLQHLIAGHVAVLVEADHHLERAAETVLAGLYGSRYKLVALIYLIHHSLLVHHFGLLADHGVLQIRRKHCQLRRRLFLGLGFVDGLFGHGVHRSQQTRCYQRNQRQRQQHVRQT